MIEIVKRVAKFAGVLLAALGALVLIVPFVASVATPSGQEAKERPIDAVDAAYNLCSVFRSKQIATECAVDGTKIDAIIPMSATEARKMCDGVKDLMMAQYRGVFGGRWELRLSSPYSVAPIATCVLY